MDGKSSWIDPNQQLGSWIISQALKPRLRDERPHAAGRKFIVFAMQHTRCSRSLFYPSQGRTHRKREGRAREKGRQCAVDKSLGRRQGEFETFVMSAIYGADDKQERISAFLEKRKPNFKGRNDMNLEKRCCSVL